MSYPLAIQVSSGDLTHAAVGELGCNPPYRTACGLTDANVATISTRGNEVNCPECLAVLSKTTTQSLTVNGLVELAYGTAKANGWHDLEGEMLTRNHAYFQLAGLTRIKLALARVVEAIRKPAKYNLDEEITELVRHVDTLRRFGPAFCAEGIREVAGELDTRAQGSLTQMLAWLHLIDSESAEAMEAAIKRDKANFAEELADIAIRLGDDVGAINDMPGHPLGPIDLEAAIRAKDARNKTRGWRHGGNRA